MTPVGHAAHEVRYFGNDMAHGDFIQPVPADDVTDVVALMDEFLFDACPWSHRANRL